MIKMNTPAKIRSCINKGSGNWKDIGTGHVRGYAGLVHTSLMISEYIPRCKTYCEPFAGLGRVAKHIKADQIILNDKSEYAYKFLKSHFNAIVTNLDFEEMFKIYDGPETVFLIDPPWSKSEYENGCRNRAFCDRTPKEYYDSIFEWIPKLKGQWFLCGNKNNNRLRNPNYYHKLFTSKRKIMGGNISTLVMSNKQFERLHQKSILMELTQSQHNNRND